jgi:hypothetical protein
MKKLLPYFLPFFLIACQSKPSPDETLSSYFNYIDKREYLEAAKLVDKDDLKKQAQTTYRRISLSFGQEKNDLIPNFYKTYETEILDYNHMEVHAHILKDLFQNQKHDVIGSFIESQNLAHAVVRASNDHYSDIKIYTMTNNGKDGWKVKLQLFDN